MDTVIKLNNQTAGRDKLARLAQYLSRLVWHQLELRKANKYTVDRVKNLESTCSSFRKILRFGRCIDSLYASVDASCIDNKWVRITLTISKLANSLYLFADHIVWLTKTGFISKVDPEKWTQVANKYWLISIVMNLARDFYELLQILNLNRKSLLYRNHCIFDCSRLSWSSVVEKANLLLQCHKDVFVDTLKNSCDLFIPLTALGYTRLSPSTIGFLGAVSSAAAILTMVEPVAKLSPI